MICGLGSGWLTCAPDSQGGLRQGGTSGRDSACLEICRERGHHVLPAGVADGHQGVVHRMETGSSALPRWPCFFKTAFSCPEHPFLAKQDVCIPPY